MGFHIVAFITATQGSEDLIRETLLGLVEPARAEAGNLSYTLTEVQDRPGSFATVEHWKAPADFQSHMEEDYVLDALKVLDANAPDPVIHSLVDLV